MFMRKDAADLLQKIIVFIFVFLAGVGIGLHFDNIKGAIEKALPEQSLRDFSFKLYWDVYDRLETEYVDPKKLDDKKMYYGSIKGMVSAIGDPATVFLDPEENAEYKSSLSPKYEGIGVMLDLMKGLPHVVTVLDGSPAEKAGLKNGDLIIKVGNKDIINMPLSKIVTLIKGKAGTEVKLTIIRPSEGNKKLEITITRGEITVPSMRLSQVVDNVAVIRVSRFTESKVEMWVVKWEEIVRSVKDKIDSGEVKGIVLDLRNNPGGYFESAIVLLSDFLQEGTIVAYQAGRNGIVRDFRTEHSPNIPMNIPLVILVNDGTASAAEIVAGALKYYKRAYIVGVRTYGKGTVQKPIEYRDGSALHITVYKWLLPDKSWINRDNPILPDKEVKFDYKLWETKKVDNQLKEGINYIHSKLKEK